MAAQRILGARREEIWASLAMSATVAKIPALHLSDKINLLKKLRETTWLRTQLAPGIRETP
jgi:hypothetical protein